MIPREGMDRPCVACYKEETETWVAFDGSGKWLVAGLVSLGVPRREADATIRYIWMTEGGLHGSGIKTVVPRSDSEKLGPLPRGRNRMIFAVCLECAQAHDCRVSDSKLTVPCYVQPEYAVEVN